MKDLIHPKKRYNFESVFSPPTRMAAQGGQEQSEDDFVEAKEAMVCPDTQFLGLLQEL